MFIASLFFFNKKKSKEKTKYVCANLRIPNKCLSLQCDYETNLIIKEAGATLKILQRKNDRN